MEKYGPICFAKTLGVNEEDSFTHEESLRLAIEENPRNASLTLPPTPNLSHGTMRLATMTRNFWKAGKELKIGFYGGTPWQKQKVKQYAPEWTKYANLKFSFVEHGELDILIAFDPKGGSNSHVGTRSAYWASRNKPSMNLGWIKSGKSEQELRSVILHEFGHALGAVHEHESPYADIPWDTENVYRDLGGPPNNWSRAKVDRNMFTHYGVDTVQATEFDPHSIMLYYYPPEWTLNRKGTQNNYELSEKDKAYIRFCYPPDALDAGVFSTMEIRPWQQPQVENHKYICYHRQYDSVPELPVGITSLDMANCAGIRIKATASDATTGNFKASLDAWADTILYSASLTFLEKNSQFDYIQTGIYNTQETRPWWQPQATQSKRIQFRTPFRTPPKVITWLQALDMDETKNWRVKVYPTCIDTHGFTVHVDTWSDSVLSSAGVTWLAYPADQPGVASGTFNTMDIRPWYQPRHENVGTFKFPKAFTSTPKVIMALNWLDYDCTRNLRVRLSTSGVTKTDLTWHLQSWWDSTMYSAGASFFAWV